MCCESSLKFAFTVYSIKLGTLDTMEAADTEWVLRPYMNTAHKRQFLSDKSMFEDAATDDHKTDERSASELSGQPKKKRRKADK